MSTDLSPEAQRLLQQARSGFSPDAARVAALRARISTQLADRGLVETGEGTQDVSRGTSSPAGPAGRLGTWGATHVIGAALLASALGVGGYSYFQSSGERKSPPGAVVSYVGAPNAVDAPSGAAQPNLAPGPPASMLPSPSLAEPVPSVAEPVVNTARDRAPAVPSSASRGPARARVHADKSSDPAPISVNDSLAEEIRLLRDARSALDRGDGARTLASLRQHEEQFGRGTLYEERLATQVQALCLVGRIDAARHAASELARAAPHSPHLARVNSSCVGQPAPKPPPAR